MKQKKQHRVQTTHPYYNAAKKYNHPIPADARTRLKYYIRELRLRPQRLTKGFQEQEQESRTSQETRHDWEEWGDIKKLGKLHAET